MADHAQPTKRSDRRAVTFSQFSELALVPRDDDDDCRAHKFYSPNERGHFRQALIRDATRMSQEMKAKPIHAITQDQLRDCIGIELFVTPGLARRVAEQKRLHIDAVLFEQGLQRDRGVDDPARLASVSERISAPSVERARKLAEGYIELVC